MAESCRWARGERGSVTPLIIGFAVILMVLVAVVLDASAAFVKRQDLGTLAEGAALQGADLGAEGREVYTGGLTDAPLRVTPSAASAAVRTYLRQVGAYDAHPGLAVAVRVEGPRVTVELTAPAELPLTFPGASETASVTGRGSAVTDPET
ncbi:pilus assembly protein TadG-related protein [Nocardioides litoris]|uniref:pilus assembly protein TadG-related protein n=1 Tax=Nocardioides litoris TaxID=1926648 RepID=UPI001FEC8E87|nr:pilus assembly protein TadG-related protein [Nocardioides litoris]